MPLKSQPRKMQSFRSAWNLFFKYLNSKKLQQNHLVKESRYDMQELSELTAKLSVFLRMIGMDLLNKNFKPSAYTYFYGISIVMVHVYSINFTILNWPNYRLIMRALSTYGFAWQVCKFVFFLIPFLHYFSLIYWQMIFKYMIFLNGLPQIQNLLEQITILHKTYSNGSGKRKEPLLWCIKIVNLISNVNYILFTSTTICYTIASLYFYFFMNIRELPMGMLIPFLDNSSLAVYFLNLIVQVFLVMQLAVGIMTNFDNVMILFLINAITYVDQYKLDLEDFGEYLENEERKDPKEVKERLKIILLRHHEIIA